MTTPVSTKPKKPYSDFPLFPHATGRWAKKIRGKLHYFGTWNDPSAALKKYQDERDDLQAGRTPRVSGEGLNIRDLANRFLTSKQHLVTTGEIVQRTFNDYYVTCERLISELGRNRLVSDLASDDFEHLRRVLSKSRGPVALGNEIQRVRTVFKFALDSALIAGPVRFGPGFRKPNRKTMRRARNAAGPRMFEAEELRQILDAVETPLKAIILLGINGGLGQADLAALPISAINFDSAILDYPRQKTAIPRKIPLWPETLAALQDALRYRPRPKLQADSELVFITKYGFRWVRTNENGTSIDSVGWEFRKLLIRLGLKRSRVSFYALRHTFETIGGESKDQIGVDHIMGHVRDDMASVYRERVSVERLRAVTEHVRGWLLGMEEQAVPAKAAGISAESAVGDKSP